MRIRHGTPAIKRTRCAPIRKAHLLRRVSRWLPDERATLPVLRVTAQYLVLLDGAEEVSVEIGSGHVSGTRGGIAGTQGTQGTRQSRWDGWRLAHGDWSALYDDALHDSYRRAE